ncbi:MAG: C69 family dipeptidase [Bacteroidetes bacterium]|nr:C69 family dipeptidase [Bacteroidota bacterium]MBU1579706.1 C69 family dipeptidase [Bacteroidota bacterium]MBU2558579.1 C69 family dipeptidase [Bacteroidota bacterium]
MSFKKVLSLCSLVLLLFIGNQAKTCTNYLITKGASVDGSTMISYAADSHIRYGELYFSPRADWPEGSMLTVYDRGTAEPLGEIPQVPHTYQTIGFMNEFQVAIGETTFGGRSELQDTTGLMDYAALMFIALQRSKSAREAIQVIATLVEEHGYASSGESFSIGDPNEVWIMEIVGKGTEMKYDRKSKQDVNIRKGAVWVAIRIPDGYISAHANHARITTFPFADGKTAITEQNWDKLNTPELRVIYASDVVDFAREKAYFDGADNAFSFSDVYAPLDFGAARFCELRVWSMFSQVNSQMDTYWDYATGLDLEQERMPLFIKPDRKISVADLMQFKRNYLQGTELDMSQDAGAGPYGLPYRWRPLTWEHEDSTYFNERVTVTQQTGFSFIAQMRSWLPDAIGGINWFGVDDAGTTVYIPFYASIERVPDAFKEGHGDILTYTDDAAFWVFNRVAHFAYLFYNRVMPDVKAVQSELENKFVNYVDATDAAALQLYEDNPQLAVEYLTDYSCNMAEMTVRRWKSLGEFLLVKYLDGNRKQEKDGKFLRNPWGYPQPPEFPGYPDSYKKQIIEETGDRFLYR